jgi:hypothetical protein
VVDSSSLVVNRRQRPWCAAGGARCGHAHNRPSLPPFVSPRQWAGGPRGWQGLRAAGADGL